MIGYILIIISIFLIGYNNTHDFLYTSWLEDASDKSLLVKYLSIFECNFVVRAWSFSSPIPKKSKLDINIKFHIIKLNSSYLLN